MYCPICATRWSIRGVRGGDAEALTNLRPVIFVQYAAGTPRSEVGRHARRRQPQASPAKVIIA